MSRQVRPGAAKVGSTQVLLNAIDLGARISLPNLPDTGYPPSALLPGELEQFPAGSNLDLMCVLAALGDDAKTAVTLVLSRTAGVQDAARQLGCEAREVMALFENGELGGFAIRDTWARISLRSIRRHNLKKHFVVDPSKKLKPGGA